MDVAADSAAGRPNISLTAEQQVQVLDILLSSEDGRVLFAWLLLQRYHPPHAADGCDEYYDALIECLDALPPAPRRYWQPFKLLGLARGFLAAAPIVDVNALLRLLDWRRCAPPLAKYCVCGAKVSLLRKLPP